MTLPEFYCNAILSDIMNDEEAEHVKRLSATFWSGPPTEAGADGWELARMALLAGCAVAGKYNFPSGQPVSRLKRALQRNETRGFSGDVPHDL
jgi:hypothetical protein